MPNNHSNDAQLVMMSSTLNSKQEERNWAELPCDIMMNILNRIGMVDILENAQKVCTAWRKVCNEPAMWRVINMNHLWTSAPIFSIVEMCKHAVDRSQGQLVDITLVHAHAHLGELYQYVADRSNQLRRLEMVSDSGGIKGTRDDSLMKFPMLEELSLYKITLIKVGVEKVGLYCPMLRTLKMNREACRSGLRGTDERSFMKYNEVAIAIGENLPKLTHLELIGNNITNLGLQAILDGCRHLETLDLRKCFYIDLKGDLGKRCSKQIKYLKLPEESLEGCPYIYEVEDFRRLL